MSLRLLYMICENNLHLHLGAGGNLDASEDYCEIYSKVYQ